MARPPAKKKTARGSAPIDPTAYSAFIRQIFRFFTKEFQVDMQPSALDPRFTLAVALLALMAEARREESN